ncbi:MAG: FtsX-like permease family protein, partial [Actinomadura sp.]
VVRGGPVGDASVACAELARVVSVPCPHRPGAPFPPTASQAMWATFAGLVEPGPSDRLLPVRTLYVPTDGSIAAEERVRTRAAVVLPRAIVSTRQDGFRQSFDSRLLSDLDAGMRMVTLFVIIVAGCSLTVSVINGLVERRRAFALLRASGVGLGELRRIVLLETVVPMVFTVFLAAALGAAPGLAFSIIEEQPYPGPGLDFAVLLGGGVLAALAITTVALPLMQVMTRYDAIRHE